MNPMKHLISMRDLSKEQILFFVDVASKIENKQLSIDLSQFVAALLFFEPSTRTMFSFDTAMKQLKGNTLVMPGASSTSVQKGETLQDTVATISRYSDIIIMRHPLEGSVRYVSECQKIDVPIINAGDGANQHPTQALLDVYSIYKTQSKLKNIRIGFVGDLKFGRTVHSLAQAMSLFNAKMFFISPEFLQMPQPIKNYLESASISFEEHETISECIQNLDILYVTRVQKERFADPDEYAKAKGSYVLNRSMLSDVRPNFKIMHPLPRVDEISVDVDYTPYAYYFDQVENGVYMRQAILAYFLGVVK